jgi:hypothetical protein
MAMRVIKATEFREVKNSIARAEFGLVLSDKVLGSIHDIFKETFSIPEGDYGLNRL